MTMLENLYYGNIIPHERNIRRGSRQEKLMSLLCQNEEKLESTLTEQQKETFVKFKLCQDELHCLMEQETFSEGFRIGLRLAVESFIEESTEQNI